MQLPQPATPWSHPAAAPAHWRGPSVVPQDAAQGGSLQLAFVLFLLVNAFLYIRPAEYSALLYGLPLYQALIIPTLLLALPVLFTQIDLRSLESRPVTACVLGLFFCVVVSQLGRGALEAAWKSGTEFFKVVLYFLLLMGLVTTPKRLRGMLFWVPLFCLLISTAAVLQHHRLVNLERITQTRELQLANDWEEAEVLTRLAATGIFQDPNDLCVMVAVCIVICLYWLGDQSQGAFRILWLLPLLLFGYVVFLTHSRGGLLALLVGLFVLFQARFGLVLALLLGAMTAPAVLMLAGSRQAGISVSAGTAQTRIQSWSDCLLALRSNPVFGVGHGNLTEHIGNVAHNSYVQAFAELGLLGGILFNAAFIHVLVSLLAMGKGRRHIPDLQLARLQPFLGAALAAYMTGMFSLTLNDMLPTYTVLGLAAAYIHMTPCQPPLPARRFDVAFLLRGAGIGFAVLAVIYLFMRTFKS